jgi:hypothetical protein
MTEWLVKVYEVCRTLRVQVVEADKLSRSKETVALAIVNRHANGDSNRLLTSIGFGTTSSGKIVFDVTFGPPVGGLGAGIGSARINGVSSNGPQGVLPWSLPPLPQLPPWLGGASPSGPPC